MRASAKLWSGFAIIAASAVALSAALPAEASGLSHSRATSVSRWHEVPSANPAMSGDNVLSAVACPTANCMAVGSAGSDALFEQESPAGWTTQQTIAKKGYVEVDGLSCPSSTSCDAVGFDDRGALAFAYNGHIWSPKQVHDGASNLSLAGVSCPAKGDCWAVGQSNGDEGYVPAIIRLRDGSWHKVTAAAAGKNAVFAAVSCPSTTRCFAVGSRQVAGGQLAPLVERWDGKSWQRMQANGPTKDSSLNAIQCSESNACIAVGNIYDPQLISGPAIVETLSGNGWQVTYQGASKEVVQLSGLACLVRCVAVGTKPTAAGNSSAFFLNQGTKSWTTAAVKQPNYYATMASVACVTVGNCEAVGSKSPTKTSADLVTLAMTNG